ncbi:MAG TPA: hypothetical protein VE984_00245 [Gaiellaceae bacterium]|nr:hypothetical protein [Gaiellaceae bacterium]
MLKGRFRGPSPALVISLIALFLALGGTSVAATKVILAKHADKKADTKLVKKLAPSLSVKHAKTANSATTAASATHATTADSATNATNATNATTAANATALGGISASGYTRRDCSSLTGQIKGFARINDAAVSTTSLSTAGVEAAYNCSGGSIRRL